MPRFPRNEVIIIDDHDHDDRSPTPKAFPEPVEAHLNLRYIDRQGFRIMEGTVVEINPLPLLEKFKVQFLQVQLIRKEGEDIIVRGLPFARARQLQGMVEKKANEVVAILNVKEDDTTEWTTQAAVEINLHEIICIRQLQFTNASYPTHRYEIHTYANRQDADDHGKLTCRWKMISSYQKKGRLHKRTLVRLRAHESDRMLSLRDDYLLHLWRGGKVKGGSYRPLTIDLTGNPAPNINGRNSRSPGQKYTLADFFCGAGGVSCGAKMAGFQPTVACDLDSNASASYKRNFPRTDMYNISVHDYLTEAPDYMVDVLHLSPPCQFWSPAHTREGQNDEFNRAGLYACVPVLEKLKPRIVTVEQTFGLTHDRFQEYFNMFLHCFTMKNYSVTYKVVDLSAWGLSQKRMRLIMIASCPGERLPPFPSDDERDLPGSVTIAQALSTIGPGATLHNVDEALARAHNNACFPKVPYNSNTLLRHIITTGGGNYHPSGKRGFTTREYATLQGFPSTYEFAGKAKRRQIGNAFPPPSVKVLYEHLEKWLLNEDGIKVKAVDHSGDAVMVHMEDMDVDNEDEDDLMVMSWRERSATLPL